MKWKTCDNWDDLPEGSWLVKTGNIRRPYHIADMKINPNGGKVVIVGNHFSWDMGKIIAYTPYEKYTGE